MAKLLKLKLGVSDDPGTFQPSLNDCLEAMLQQSDYLVSEMIGGLVAATAPNSPQRIAGFQQAGLKKTVLALSANADRVRSTFRDELARLVYEGGGKEQAHAEVRFEDLRLFEDAQLDHSIEVARAQQEVSIAVDDVLPQLDALVSTLLGWRTIQPGLNPVRPEAFVRALQKTLTDHVPDAQIREALITPAAGLLGANLRRLYREMAEWLRSAGVEPAVPIGGRVQKGSGAAGAMVTDKVAQTLLTLDKLRKLLHGDFDAANAPREFVHTLPASMGMLQEMDQVDELVHKLQSRPKQPPPAPPTDMLAEPEPEAVADESPPRLGVQLGAEVVRLMFENLTRDKRLLAEYKAQLARLEPLVLALASDDSRFFSDRTHPARHLLERMTQRSLAFANSADPGWERFIAGVREGVDWLAGQPAEADSYGELLDRLQERWNEHDQVLQRRREEAARALLRAEQRNLLAQRLAEDFQEQMGSLEVPPFVADFLRTSWAQVVAEAQLSGADPSSDPYGYRTLVDDLVWSVQRSTATRGRAKRLIQMIPGLLAKLREGLERIGYPPELTARFFNNLIVIHRAAVLEGRDELSKAQAEAVEAQASLHAETTTESVDALWLGKEEVRDAGFVRAEDVAPAPGSAAETSGEPAVEPARAAELRTGTWVELVVQGEWVRAQLTWCSPAGTLFMFTSQAGTAHSMSRRTLDRLRAEGQIKVIADRNVVDEALDEVARAALQNSLDGKRDE